ncbi:MAG TPA: M23 family metallopeptidase [Candidatus Cloacimonadota bacterium]|nr:M23 family metallopeptidase [Candidatus Cloacimonadota bacterium]
MKRFFLIGIIFVLLIVLIGVATENSRNRQEVRRLQHELDIATKYIQYLNEQFEPNSENETSPDDKMKEILKNYLKEQNPEESKISSGSENYPNLIPVHGEYAISQHFSTEHPALDFAAAEGTEVVAAAAGEVLSVYRDKYFGNVMIIDHLNEYATLYAHLATAIQTSKTAVKKGETIGLVGNTGFSSAPHLHFEIMKNGKNLDPEKILKITEK